MAQVFEPVHAPTSPLPTYSFPPDQAYSPGINVSPDTERTGAAVSQQNPYTCPSPAISMPRLAHTRGDSGFETASHHGAPPLPDLQSAIAEADRLSPATVARTGSPGLLSTGSDRRASASSSTDPQSTENFEPLRYHHLPVEEPSIKALEKRASRLTFATSHSEASTGSDQPARNSVVLPTIPRPDSGFSSASDLRGRASESYLSAARPSPGHSRSPDTRPLSYVDLLNVPYCPPVPCGAENLVNLTLRDAVGSNVSLMSTRKTLEMYRANVKKTNDPAIQYEFAVFMVGAAQEERLEADAQSEDGKSTKSGTTIREDLLKEARQILQKLCDRSYPFAQYYLGDGYASGLFTKGREDWDKAFPLFLAAAKHGHAEASYRAALCYEFGWGCRPDAIKALQFYQHAGSKNHPGAMARLGRACLTGEMGLHKRYREGVRWLKRAVESADFQYNQAPFDLACLHETGFGPDVFKDPSYAAQLYTKAADLGHVEANHRLGEAYEYGQLNCPRDPALSVHFYTGAAERGHAPSQMALCAWYLIGIEHVLEKDEAEAYEWAKRAALQDLPRAQYTLAYFTEVGIGCRRDQLEANVWYVKAAELGEERAKQRIAAIRKAVTGQDLVVEEEATTAAKKKEKTKPGKAGKADKASKQSKARSDGALSPSPSSASASASSSASPPPPPAAAADGGEKKKRFGIF